jgi:hypothetical protein
MRYQSDLVVPPYTPQAAPAQVDIPITAGTLTQAQVYFRAGPHNVVFITLLSGVYQLIPAHGTAPLFGDDKIYTIPMNFKVDPPGQVLTLTGWAPACRYPHTITLWLDLATDEAAQAPTFQDQMNYLMSTINRKDH